MHCVYIIARNEILPPSPSPPSNARNVTVHRHAPVTLVFSPSLADLFFFAERGPSVVQGAPLLGRGLRLLADELLARAPGLLEQPVVGAVQLGIHYRGYA